MSLPSGYTPLEYIKSSGTQYINTGFNPNQNTRKVTFEGKHYISLIDGNVYSPAAYPAGWQEQA